MYSSRAQPESSSEWWLGWRGTTPVEDPSAPPPEAPCWLTAAGDDWPALAAPPAAELLSMEALRLVLLGGLPVLLEVPEVVPGEQLVPAWTRLLGATPPADIRNGSKE